MKSEHIPAPGDGWMWKHGAKRNPGEADYLGIITTPSGEVLRLECRTFVPRGGGKGYRFTVIPSEFEPGICRYCDGEGCQWCGHE